MKQATALLALFAGLVCGLDVSKLEPRGYVSDFANVIDTGSAAQIEKYCGDIQRSTGAQLAVVTVKSLEGDTIEQAATSLFNRWGVGSVKKNDGVMILLSINDRNSRIEVGRGLEQTIPDEIAAQILRDIRPRLSQGQYGQALLSVAHQVGARIAALPVPAGPPTRRGISK